MASADVGDLRKQRLYQMRPFLKYFSAEKEPRTDRGTLLQLIQDMRDEGNDLFKEGDKYEKAVTHYKNAIFVAHDLEDRFYHNVNLEFMATLYSNCSIALLRLAAQKLQPDNPKAIYHRTNSGRTEALQRSFGNG
ncbi:hypothetical protein ACOMHN_009945 [Nucella lapillus]